MQMKPRGAVIALYRRWALITQTLRSLLQFGLKPNQSKQNLWRLCVSTFEPHHANKADTFLPD